MTPGWLGPETARLRGAYTAGRLPHALLIHEAPGAGGEWLAGWAATHGPVPESGGGPLRPLRILPARVARDNIRTSS